MGGAGQGVRGREESGVSELSSSLAETPRGFCVALLLSPLPSLFFFFSPFSFFFFFLLTVNTSCPKLFIFLGEKNKINKKILEWRRLLGRSL